MGKWVKESEDAYHYFKSDDGPEKDRLVLIGDVVVTRARFKIFEPNGLWFAVALNGSFYDKEPSAGTPDCGNFCFLEDAKRWVEERLAGRSGAYKSEEDKG